MSDKKADKKKEQRDKDRRSYLTLVASVSGVALIISFFLPFVRFDERTTQLLLEAHSDFTRAYGRYVAKLETEQDDAKRAELAKKPVKDVLNTDFGALITDGSLTGQELRQVRDLLKSYRDFLVFPNGYTAFSLLAHSPGKADEGALRFVQVPLSRDVLGRAAVAQTIRWVVLSLLVFGLAHLLFAWLVRFGRYPMSFLVMTFIPGFIYVAFLTLMLFAQFWTQQGVRAVSDQPSGTGSVGVNQELPDQKAAIRAFESVRTDVGANLMLIAGIGMLVVSLLGLRGLGDKWHRAAIAYGIVVVICVIGIVWFHSVMQPAAPGDIPATEAG